MIMSERGTGTVRALAALEDDRSSVRLRAAMAVGTAPDERFVDKIVERCGVESDFYVRDMLTWALTRHSASATVPRLLEEVRSGRGQGRSQALHTLSKIGDARGWEVITPEVLADGDDEVARSAWRAAVVLAPEGEKAGLGAVLVTQLGRGGRKTRLSLSQALVALGQPGMPMVRSAMTHTDPRVRRHAIATERLFREPEAGFEDSIEEAKRLVALGETPRE